MWDKGNPLTGSKGREGSSSLSDLQRTQGTPWRIAPAPCPTQPLHYPSCIFLQPLTDPLWNYSTAMQFKNIGHKKKIKYTSYEIVHFFYFTRLILFMFMLTKMY